VKLPLQYPLNVDPISSSGTAEIFLYISFLLTLLLIISAIFVFPTPVSPSINIGPDL
jgi:hypothetical protein